MNPRFTRPQWIGAAYGTLAIPATARASFCDANARTDRFNRPVRTGTFGNAFSTTSAAAVLFASRNAFLMPASPM